MKGGNFSIIKNKFQILILYKTKLADEKEEMNLHKKDIKINLHNNKNKEVKLIKILEHFKSIGSILNGIIWKNI